jgi:hypothetical protein
MTEAGIGLGIEPNHDLVQVTLSTASSMELATLPLTPEEAMALGEALIAEALKGKISDGRTMSYRANGRRSYYVPGPRNLVGWDRPREAEWDLVPNRGLNLPTQAHWSTEAADESEIPVLHGHRVEDLCTQHGPEWDLGWRGPLAERQERQLPLFVLVRAEGSHNLYQVEATTTRARVTRPKPLPAAKLALARMRSVFAEMGKVTA